MSNALVDRLLAMLGPPTHTDNTQAYVAELGRLTAGFDRNALDLAASTLLRNAGKGWPSPKAIVDACADAQEGQPARVGVGTLPESRKKWPWELDAERAEAWAKEFVTQSRWQAAHDEGWERSLRLWAQSFAREHYRHGQEPDKSARPKPDEIEHWQRYCRMPVVKVGEGLTDQEFVDRAADGTLELRGPFTGELRRMARLMQARRPADDEPTF